VPPQALGPLEGKLLSRRREWAEVFPRKNSQ
jgi:hypothetical protein